MAQVIEHVIAETVNHPGLDDCVVESGVAHDLFRFPLRLVIRRTAVCSRTQETNQHDLLNTSGFSRIDNVAGSFDVYALIGLISNLTIDAGTMSDDFTVAEQLSENTNI